MTDAAGLPILHDIDADYTPRYAMPARILRAKTESGACQHGDALPAIGMTPGRQVPIKVAWSKFAMPAANRYVTHLGSFSSYSITWQAHDGGPRADAASGRGLALATCFSSARQGWNPATLTDGSPFTPSWARPPIAGKHED